MEVAFDHKDRRFFLCQIDDLTAHGFKSCKLTSPLSPVTGNDFVAAIAAGGWVAVVVIIVICLIALILGSVFGIFFSGDSPSNNGDYISMPAAVQEINADYDDQLTSIRNGTAYDNLEMSGSRAVWKEVIAVYAVKTNIDPDNAQEVATMDEDKKQLLTDIFWEMNDISSHSETKTVIVI